MYVPLATFLMSPARIMSLWLVISASAGTCFTVGIKVWLYLIVYVSYFVYRFGAD